jgi:hypothetical protein
MAKLRESKPELWERQPWESAADFRSFQYYLRQEPPRSVGRAYREYRSDKGIIEGDNKPAPGTWRNRAKNLKHPERPTWSDRAVAWDNHLASVANAAVERKWAKEAMSKTEVLGRLGEQARVDISIFFINKLVPYRTKDGNLILDKDNEPMTYETWDVNWENVKKYGHLVKSISSTQHGPKLELYDGQAALAHIGRHLQLFTDNIDLKSNGQPLTTTENLNDDQFSSAVGNLAQIGMAIAGRKNIPATAPIPESDDPEG